MNDLELRRRNAEYDNIIRKVFKSYPSVALRKTLDEVNTKYNNEILNTFRSNIKTNTFMVAMDEFIIEAAKLMCEYLGFEIDELPSICVLPYIHRLQKQGEEVDELLKAVLDFAPMDIIFESFQEVEKGILTLILI